MTLYDDGTITVDGSGITIRNYHRPGHSRQIPFADIVGAELIPLRLGTGRLRLVGFSPGRPRHFFHWDPGRASKAHAVSLDVGRWRRIALTPSDPAAVLAIVESRVGRLGTDGGPHYHRRTDVR